MNNRKKLHEAKAIVSSLERTLLKMPLPADFARRPAVKLQVDAIQNMLSKLSESITSEIVNFEIRNGAK